jgi:hypothetical protein
LYCTKRFGTSNGGLLKIDLKTKSVDTIDVGETNIKTPYSLHLNKDTDELYWSDLGRKSLNKINLRTNEISNIISSDFSWKDWIVYRDSILFYQDDYIKFYDLKKRYKKIISEDRNVRSVTLDSAKNIYWYDTEKDSIMKYHFESGYITSLLEYNSVAFSKMEWLRDNSLLFLDMNRGFYRYDLDEEVLYEMDASNSPTTFTVDDRTDNIYYIDDSPFRTSPVECIDFANRNIDFKYEEEFQYINDLGIMGNKLYMAESRHYHNSELVAEGGIIEIDLESFESRRILDSIHVQCLYVAGRDFNDLPEYYDATFKYDPELKSSISVYPNPVSKNQPLRVRTTAAESVIELYNVVGRLVFQRELFYKDNSIDLSVHPGIYFYRLRDQETGEINTGKLLIE